MDQLVQLLVMKSPMASMITVNKKIFLDAHSAPDGRKVEHQNDLFLIKALKSNLVILFAVFIPLPTSRSRQFV